MTDSYFIVLLFHSVWLACGIIQCLLGHKLMSFSYLTVPLVSGGWGCSSQTNEIFGVLPSTPAETITVSEYGEALERK